MNWREKTVIRILLMVAATVAGEKELRDKIYELSNHIAHSTPDREAAA
jgi:hypothetical protein